MDTYTIESDEEEFYVRKDSSLGFIRSSSKYRKSKRKESLTIKDLYEILTDQNNKNLQKELKITNNKKQNVSFKNDENNKNFFLLETDNKTEVFRKSDFKKVKEEIKEGANRTVKIFYNNIEKIERFNSNNEKLSEEIINREDNTRKRSEFHEDSKIIEQFNSDNKRISEEIINIKDNSRKYTEFFDGEITFEKLEKFGFNNKKLFEETIDHKENIRTYTEYHKKGNTILEMQKNADSSKQKYTIKKFDKNNKLIDSVKSSWEKSNRKNSFEVLKNNNFLGHKPDFVLDEQHFGVEKFFKKYGINTQNNSFHFNEGEMVSEEEVKDAICKEFGYDSYDELDNEINSESESSLKLFRKVNSFREAFLLKKRVEFLKKNSLSLKKIGKEGRYATENLIYSVGTGEEKRTFKLKEVREFNDGDKLKIKVCRNGKLKLECDNAPIKPKTKYYFTIPSKSSNIYLFKSVYEHHSYFPWDKEKNPNFSVVAAGYFTLDENGKISEIVNDSGHFKPSSKDCTESFLRVLSKNMFSALKNNGENIESRGIEELLSKRKKVDGKGYNISKDITKLGGGARNTAITPDSAESWKAISTVMEQRLNLINENAKEKCRV